MKASVKNVTAKVTVVVPVYNPGSYIDPLIDSLLAQTLPAGQFEVVFVDDGSTDATPARLDELARTHPHMHVIHQPNSGWPGQPRNVGIDAATGAYIQFVDHDDYLAVDALQRLYERAVETDADVVLGKIVSLGRAPRLKIYRQRRDHATLATDPLELAMSPHKLFRTAMLREYGIRFPEGKRRLEDQPFVMRSYFAAQSVAILADAPCYYLTRREDRGNYSSDRIDPAAYFRNVRETIDVVEANTEPGRLRERILRRFYRKEMLIKLQEPKILRLPEEYRKQLFNEVRQLGEERFPDSVPDRLPMVARLRSVLLREGDLDGLITFAERCSRVRASAILSRVEWKARALHVEATTQLVYSDGTPVLFVPVADGLRIDPMLTIGLFDDGVADLADDQVVRQACGVEVTVRQHGTGIEWTVPSTMSARLVPVESRGRASFAVQFTGTVEIDPLVAREGGGLAPGVWAVGVYASFGGLRRYTGLAAGTGELPRLPATRTVRHTGWRVRPLLAGRGGTLDIEITPARTSRRPARRGYVFRLGRKARKALSSLGRSAVTNRSSA